MSSVYPYNPIRKVPLDYQGIASSAFSVQTEENNDGLSEYKEVGVVRNNYLLIPNAEVKDLVDSLVSKTGWEWEVNREWSDGKRYVYTLMARDKTRELAVGDRVGLGLNAWNSYDGSIAFNIRFLAFRLECLNGMVSNDVFHSFRFRHDKTSEGYEKEIEQVGEMFNAADDKLEVFADSCDKLLTTVNTEDLSTIRSKYLNNLPTNTFGKIMDEFLIKSEYKNTAWDLTNAATRVLWHNEKPTVTDYKNNQYVVDQMFKYAKDNTIAEA
tara:strand:- start:595 stop:1401 length:807 start_codon:yes stop_codon:yes gene_type:complete